MLVSYDWFQASFLSSERSKIQGFLSGRFKCSQEKPFGRFFYDRSKIFGEGGVVLYWDSAAKSFNSHEGRDLITVSGCGWRELGQAGGVELMRLVQSVGGRITRLDIAFDDYSRCVTPGEIAEQIRQAEIRVKGFRRWGQKQTRTGNALVEDVVHFGSRGSNGSGSYLRIYDKNLESGGAINAVRWELELSGDKAAMVLVELLSHSDLDYQRRVAGSILAGVVAFVALSDTSNLKWWQSITSMLCAPLKLQRKYKPESVLKTANWVLDSVAGALVFLREALGGDYALREFVQAVCDQRGYWLRPEKMEAVLRFRQEQHLAGATA